MAPLFEPEETIGRHWHRLVGDASSYPRHAEAAVPLEAVRRRLAVMFRALGGAGAVRIAAAGRTASGHRLGLRARLGLGAESLELPCFDGATMALPPVLDLLPRREENEALYEWLVAWFALAPPTTDAPPTPPSDPRQADAQRLRAAAAQTARVLAALPGLRPVQAALAAAVLAVRPRRRLPAEEAEMEAAVRAVLGAPEPLPPASAALLDPALTLAHLRAGRRYRPFLPVPLWGEVTAPVPAGRHDPSEEDAGGEAAAADARRRRARRRRNDHTRRNDPLLLTRFETILGLAEMRNLNRAVEDDDAEAARQAAEDLDEIAIGPHERRAALRLRLDLDLPAPAVEAEPLAEALVYPEWDHGRGAYHPAHCRVIAERASLEGEAWQPDAAALRRIRRVRRQFEALRPQRQVLHAQPDGEELDLSALVRAVAERRAGAPGSDRVFRSARQERRDLAVAVLVDASLSTDAWIDDRRVLDVEKEALLALAAGLDACGDEHAILAFTSRRRQAVWVRMVKDYAERFDQRVARRIEALRPGHYTRMGAAIRHAARGLAERPRNRRLLLLLTDGKPNDADHYEGRYAIEDTRMAIREARRSGLHVFGITVDREAGDYVPYLFGRGAYAIFPHIARLPVALPAIYRQVAG